jgi:hypothetical protein
MKVDNVEATTAQEATTVGILGEDTMFENILETLLRNEGYDARIIEESAASVAQDPFAGIEVLLLSPNMDADYRRALLGGAGSDKISGRPVLEISTALKLAMLDAMAFTITWRALFENLMQRIEVALDLDRTDTG